METIYGKDFVGNQQFMLGQMENSIASRENLRANIEENGGVPLLSSRQRIEVGGIPTEVILQKFRSTDQSQSPRELTLDSSQEALKKSKKRLVLFGNNASFQPETHIPKERLKGIIVKEGMEMELFRPF